MTLTAQVRVSDAPIPDIGVGAYIGRLCVAEDLAYAFCLRSGASSTA